MENDVSHQGYGTGKQQISNQMTSIHSSADGGMYTTLHPNYLPQRFCLVWMLVDAMMGKQVLACWRRLEQ
jgi:hypothetical protein